MTTASWQIQCPKCDTNYRVTEEILKTARGTVRCSKCQEIFNATQYLKSSIKEVIIPEKKKRKRLLFFKKDKNDKSSATEAKKSISPFSLKAQLNQLVRDPSLSKVIKPRSWFLWFLFDLLVITALIGQYIYFNFNELKKDPAWQPILSTICAPIGCESSLLLYSEKSSNPAFVADQFVVRSTASHKGVLVIDAVIRNQTSEPKPLPRLKLVFMSKNNTPIAARVFTPEEYLPDTFSDSKLIQSGMPVHLSFHVIDPGATAERYRLSFH